MAEEKEKNRFLLQGSILALAGIISRIIGLIFKIPLIGIIGEEGMGVYNTAYSIYNILLLISSYSLPTAVSRLISEKFSLGEYRSSKKVFAVSLLFGLCLGTAASLIMLWGAEFFAETVMQMPEAAMAVRLLAPAVFLMGILGVFRGFFQGQGNMVPTALSQILEQLFHVAVSLLAAAWLLREGALLDSEGSSYYASAYGAGGATVGTAVGALSALVFLFLLYLKKRPSYIRKCILDRKHEEESTKQTLKNIVSIALPVLLSAAVYNLITVIDQAIFGQYMRSDYRSIWGIYTGKYILLYNVPVAISNALSSSAIPAITAYVSKKNIDGAVSKTEASIRFSLLIAFPCAVGLGVLGKPCMDLLFRSADNTLAGQMMNIGSVALLFFSLSTLTNGVLVGLGHFWTPIRNSLISLLIHLPLLAVSLWVFDTGIMGVVVNCFLFSAGVCLLNAISLRKYLHWSPEPVRTYVKPLAASLLMGLAVWAVYRLLPFGNTVGTLCAIAAGVLLYMILLCLFKAVTEEDLLTLPGGRRVCRVLKKLRLLR